MSFTAPIRSREDIRFPWQYSNSSSEAVPSVSVSISLLSQYSRAKRSFWETSRFFNLFISHLSTSSDFALEQSSSVSSIDEHSIPNKSPSKTSVGEATGSVSSTEVGFETSDDTVYFLFSPLPRSICTLLLFADILRRMRVFLPRLLLSIICSLF